MTASCGLANPFETTLQTIFEFENRTCQVTCRDLRRAVPFATTTGNSQHIISVSSNPPADIQSVIRAMFSAFLFDKRISQAFGSTW